MGDPVDRLVRRLDLELAEAGERASTWIGQAGANAMNMGGRLFGGFVFAQTIAAAGRTFADRSVHSVQQHFLRAGQADVELEYRVEPLFAGRTYASARVEVRQAGLLIAHAQVGVTAGLPGPDRHRPSGATTTLEATVNRDEVRGRPNWQDQPVELRVDPARMTDGEPTRDLWMRPFGTIPDDPLLHQGVLGFASDRGFMDVAFKPHRDLGEYRGATVDHSIWFHRSVRFDDWHVHSIESPTIAGGRGLVTGTIHHVDGTHVATTMQQGTFRLVD